MIGRCHGSVHEGVQSRVWHPISVKWWELLLVEETPNFKGRTDITEINLRKTSLNKHVKQTTKKLNINKNVCLKRLPEVLSIENQFLLTILHISQSGC